MKLNRFLLITISLFAITSVFALSKKYKKTEIPQRIINVDYSAEKGAMNTMFKQCVGAGRANEGLRADWQQQLAFVKKECDFKYIRMHGLLTDDMAVYSEDRKGNPQYNYMYIDALYDYLLSIGVKPFVELGFMPAALASGHQTIFWWRGNVTPPKDYNKWENFISNLTQHFTERYGVDEVKTWYFEVWNEPNLSPGFWTGTQADYFKLYQYTAKAIKSVNPDYKVGGPGTAGAAWESEMIDFCVKNNIPIDFISTHSYGVKQGFLDEYGNGGTVLSKDPMSVSGDVLQSRKEIATSAKPNRSCTIPNGVLLTHLPIHFTTVIMKLHTFWKKSNRWEILQIQCRTGYLPIFLKKQGLALRLFMADSDYLPFKGFQNLHFMLTSL